MVTERIKALGWYEYNNGVKSELKSGSSIQCFSTYDFFTDNSTYYPINYKAIQLHFDIKESPYAINHYILSINSPRIYIESSSNNFSGRFPDLSRPTEIYSEVREDYIPGDLYFSPGTPEYIPAGYTTTSAISETNIFIFIRGGVSGKLYISNKYSGSFYLNLSGNTSINFPYRDVNWEICSPVLNDFYPSSNSFINEKEKNEINFSVETFKSEKGITYDLTELSFMWGENSETNNIIDIDTKNRSVIIPANTFPEKSVVYWKFRWKSEASSDYFYSDTYIYTTTDSIPNVKPVSPLNTSIDGAVNNIFKWEYQIDTSSKQQAFDLQYSNNNGLSWKDIFIKEPSNNTFAVVPANTLNAGNNLWRVRAYNTDDVASEWSTPASIVVRAAPIKPTISSITKKPKITVGWQSTGQQAFQVLANDIDSGVVFGTGKTYTIPYYFRDGETVNIKVRIKNRFSEWSEWSEISVTVENTSTGNITALAQNVGNDVKLTWATETEFVCFYVLRGGIPIAKTTDLKEYTDYTSVGANEYQIMGITADGYYTLSNVVPVSVFPKTAVIGILSNTVSWVTLTYRRGNLPEIITSSSEGVYYQYYSGRKLPVAYSSRFKTKKKTLNFTVYKQDADAIENMIGQTVIYKDYAENKIIGIVNDVETSSNANRPDVRMEITAIDYLEDVGYD